MFHGGTAQRGIRLSYCLLGLLVCLAHPTAHAFRLEIQDLEIEDQDLKEHYRIDEYPESRLPAFESPTEVLGSPEELLAKAASAVSLTHWVKMKGPLDPAPERYNRRRQFGTWRRDPNSGNCFDTRAEVLARTSLEPVTTRPSSSGRCVVVSGRWIDPYIGQTFTEGSKVTIDHMVPLKNAYLAGGWRWTNQQRCQYFNFKNSTDHLVPVSGPENSSKGDSSPADYMPPLRSYQCQYLKSWLSVKTVWGLAMAANEAEAIRDEIKQNGCHEDEMKISVDEIKRLRADIAKGTAACPP